MLKRYRRCRCGKKKENDMVWLITTCTHTRVCSSTVTYSHDQVSTEQWFHAQKQQPPSVGWSQNLAPCVWGKSHENLKSVNRSLFFFFDGLFRANKDTHLTLASALLSSRNLTICWWPVLVQWNRAVQPTESFNSKSAPCFLGFKMEKKEEEKKKKKSWMFTIKFKAQKECWI